MRILTVRQPWAWAIVEGHKGVENRTRNLAGDYRGPVAIHAAQSIDTEACFDPRIKDLRNGRPFGGIVATGVILGVVNLWAVHKHDGSERFLCCPNAPRYTRWAQPDVWHLCLATPRKLPVPYPFKGALGLRELPEGTTEALLAAVAS
ncbi:hypothetical protein [Leifsonia sp. P73]|uniref:hypothetical protein n=1 Tax=Leifsonia sp. P73 TaxID=3423959 RepID=UPI003DA2D43E